MVAETPEAQVEVAKVGVGRRPVGLLPLRGDVLVQRTPVGAAPRLGQLVFRHAGQHARGFAAHAAHRVGQQRAGGKDAVERIDPARSFPARQCVLRGSGSRSSSRAGCNRCGRIDGASNCAAVARTSGGCAAFPARANKSGTALAPCVAPASRPPTARPLPPLPAHRAVERRGRPFRCLAAMALRAGIGAADRFARSGRGTRMAWSRRGSITM